MQNKIIRIVNFKHLNYMVNMCTFYKSLINKWHLWTRNCEIYVFILSLHAS